MQKIAEVKFQCLVRAPGSVGLESHANKSDRPSQSGAQLTTDRVSVQLRCPTAPAVDDTSDSFSPTHIAELIGKSGARCQQGKKASVFRVRSLGFRLRSDVSAPPEHVCVSSQAANENVQHSLSPHCWKVLITPQVQVCSWVSMVHRRLHSGHRTSLWCI